MKRFFKMLFFLLISSNMSFALAWTIDHFQVEFTKNTAILWESVDVIIKAVDKNNEVVTDYTWNILWMSQSDDWAELPNDLSSDSWYSFKLSDQWVKKYENWVTFSTEWEHTLSVYDTNDYENLTGMWEITILKWNWPDKEIEIEILTPVTNTTLPSSNIKVSWATKKNHQVRIELNNDDEFTTISNSDWIFEKEISWFETWTNVIIAYVLDSDEKIAWESTEIIINIDDNKPLFKKIVLSPIPESWDVEGWTNIDTKVFATKWLKSVKLLFNDWVIILSETEDGIYTWSIKAPNKEEKYFMDVILIDDLWHNITEKDAASINVFEVLAPPVEPKVDLPVECLIDSKWLGISWIKLVELKNKSVLTWTKVDEAESYDIYYKENTDSELAFIKNVTDPIFEIEIIWEEIKYQYFSIQAKRKWCKEWEIVLWNMSEATKIKTWPTEILLMLLLSLILWFGFVLIKRKKA